MEKVEEKGRKLDWREACALLGCKKSHFYNLVNSGILPAIRIGRIKGLRVYEADCLAYVCQLEGNETPQDGCSIHES